MSWSSFWVFRWACDCGNSVPDTKQTALKYQGFFFQLQQTVSNFFSQLDDNWTVLIGPEFCFRWAVGKYYIWLSSSPLGGMHIFTWCFFFVFFRVLISGMLLGMRGSVTWQGFTTNMRKADIIIVLQNSYVQMYQTDGEFAAYQLREMRSVITLTQITVLLFFRIAAIIVFDLSRCVLYPRTQLTFHNMCCCSRESHVHEWA